MEIKDYALVKTLKDFKFYVLHSHVITFVPKSVMNDILPKPAPEGRRGKWIVVLI